MQLVLEQHRIDLDQGSVVHRATGTVAKLSRRELSLLRFMAERPNLDISRETLQRQVWGFSSQALTRAVDATVARLRRKVEATPNEPEFLLTVHGFGYRFVPSPAHVPSWTSPRDALPVRGMLVCAGTEIDLDRGVVRRGATVLQRLTAQEIRVLLRLRIDAGSIVARESLLQLDPDFRLTPQGLANTMHRLRRKLPPGAVETVRGAGYRLQMGGTRTGARVATEVAWSPNTVDRCDSGSIRPPAYSVPAVHVEPPASTTVPTGLSAISA